jgi:cysteine desulfurase/selenocysteine lyase
MFKNIKKDFPMFQNVKEMQGNRFVYLDNAATTFKPYCVIEGGDSYCNFYNANSHRGDYDIASKVDLTVAETRKRCAEFINAEEKEIVFTAGATMSINTIAFGFASKILKKGDEILVTEAEHASNLLPFIRFADKGVNLSYIDLDKEGRLTPENVEKAITEKTKIRGRPSANEKDSPRFSAFII